MIVTTIPDGYFFVSLDLFPIILPILFLFVLLLFVFVRNGASTRQVIRELQENRISTKDTTDKLAITQGELAGRLNQLSETQITNQNRLIDLMQSQERAVSQKLEERLADLGQRFGDGMEKSRVSQQTSLGELKERLVLNHLTILYNLFDKGATRMLFFKLRNYLDILIPFLVVLGRLPTKVEGIGIQGRIVYTNDVEVDPYVVDLLRSI